MARLRRLTLSHFRSHRVLSLEAEGGMVALHGPNGAGKTNVLEAISMLSPGRGLRRAAPEDLVRRPEAIGWKVSALIEGPDGPSEVETAAQPGARREVRVDGKAAPQAALGRLLPMLWLTPAMDRLWAEGPGERRRFLDRMALAFAPGHGDAALGYEKAMRERTRLLTEGPADPAWLSALEARMAEAGAALARARAETIARLAAAMAGAASAFPRAILRIEGASEAALGAALAAGAEMDAAEITEAAALRARLATGRRADAAAARALEGPHRSDLLAVHEAKGVEARLASTGEQKALLIAMVLAHARALKAEAGAPPLLLLDEVAAHLDAARRAALYDEIAALGAEAWMTGTGPELFEALGGRGRLVGL